MDQFSTTLALVQRQYRDFKSRLSARAWHCLSLAAVVPEPRGFSLVTCIVSPKCVFWPDNLRKCLREHCDHLENFKKENTMKRSGYTLVEVIVSLVLLAMIFGAGLGYYRLISLLISWVF